VRGLFGVAVVSSLREEERERERDRVGDAFGRSGSDENKSFLSDFLA